MFRGKAVCVSFRIASTAVASAIVMLSITVLSTQTIRSISGEYLALTPVQSPVPLTTAAASVGQYVTVYGFVETAIGDSFDPPKSFFLYTLVAIDNDNHKVQHLVLVFNNDYQAVNIPGEWVLVSGTISQSGALKVDSIQAAGPPSSTPIQTMESAKST
jgi:hypothetical protein